MDLSEQERAELRHDELWLASLMTPGPLPQAMDELRHAVRAAIGEAWLGQFEAPAPTPQVVARVKAAVREALASEGSGVVYRWLGALAAAAMIALAVGVGWMVVVMSPRPASGPATVAIADEFEKTWRAISADEELSDLRTDLTWIQTELDSWQGRASVDWDELEIERLGDRIEQLFAEETWFET